MQTNLSNTHNQHSHALAKVVEMNDSTLVDFNKAPPEMSNAFAFNDTMRDNFVPFIQNWVTVWDCNPIF